MEEWTKLPNEPVTIAVISATLGALFGFMGARIQYYLTTQREANGLLAIVAAETIFNVDRIIEVAGLHFTPEQKGIKKGIGVSRTYLFTALDMAQISQITKVIKDPDLFFAITYLKERVFHANKHFEVAWIKSSR
jgi:hypothetical protein